MVINKKTWFWGTGLAILVIVLGFVIAPYFAGIKNINPVALNFGFITIYWYGVLMLLGVLAAAKLFFIQSQSTFLKDKAVGLVSWVVLGGIIGARLMFVLLKWPEFSDNLNSIFFISNGGLSIHGALIGGLIAIIVFVKKNKMPLWSTLDLMILPVILGQIIGRFGNFINQEAFGPPANLPWKMYVLKEFRPIGFEEFAFFHPTFLYEVLGLAILFIILWQYKKKFKIDGSLFVLYIIGYSVLRFFIEFYRVDSDLWFMLTVAQWGSLLIIIIGVLLFKLGLKSKLKL